jgi:cbb3-type cytochrome oxidase subunit 3
VAVRFNKYEKRLIWIVGIFLAVVWIASQR